MWGSLCSCSWPLMSLRAGTMRRILRWWGRRRVLDLEEHWIPTSKKSFSFIVRGCLTQIMNASTQFNHILWRSYPCSCLGRENLVRIHIISIFMRAFNVVTHSHQRHHIQPEGTKALHQAAGMLAPDQHGFSQGRSHCPLPRTDLHPNEHQQLPAGCVPTAAWSVVTAHALFNGAMLINQWCQQILWKW